MLKRVMTLVLCLALVGAPALAEAAPVRALYADQGGVRVFAEDGRAGLMDSAGNVLLPAEYDAIEPFGDSDFARVWQGYREGVVRRDGSLALECRWDSVIIHGARQLATCYGHDGACLLVDLQSGETRWSGDWPPLVDDRYVYVLTFFGPLGFGGPEPPYHTDVYDRGWNRVLGVEGWIVEGFESGCAVMLDDRDTPIVIDLQGSALIDGIEGYIRRDGSRFFYVRRVQNPLDRWLKPLKLDRRHVKYCLSLLGVPVEGRRARAALGIYDDFSVCGYVDAGGGGLEVGGTQLAGPDDAGLYRVNAGGRYWASDERDRWGYADADGAFAVRPAYAEAHPFVDGAAVVRKGKRWFLIDERGGRVGDIRWKGPEWVDEAALELPVIPAGNAKDGFRIVNRRGEYAADEVFSALEGAHAGKYLVMWDRFGGGDGEKRVCLVDGSGKAALCAPASDVNLIESPPDALWILDGLWGLMEIEGEAAGTWRVEPQFTDVSRLEKDGCGYKVGLTDDTWAYIDGHGALLGPAAPPPDGF